MAARPKLEAKLATAVAAVLSGFSDVAAGYVFGSVVRGEARTDSDLDVGLVLPREMTLDGDQAARIARDLSGRTGFDTVDVVDLAEQGPIFAHEVLCEGALVYEADPARRIDFESETVSRALDFRPTYEIATQGKVEALRAWLQERYDL